MSLEQSLRVTVYMMLRVILVIHVDCSQIFVLIIMYRQNPKLLEYSKLCNISINSCLILLVLWPSPTVYKKGSFFSSVYFLKVCCLIFYRCVNQSAYALNKTLGRLLCVIYPKHESQHCRHRCIISILSLVDII